jgi:WRKY transcription factor 33
MPPPSLPLSHPPASPSSFLNAFSGFLDSPILLTPSVSCTHGPHQSSN